MKVKSESEVSESCPTLCDPMDCSLPGSSAHKIFQARVLEWGATAFSEQCSQLLAKNLEYLKPVMTVPFSFASDHKGKTAELRDCLCFPDKENRGGWCSLLFPSFVP